MEWATQVCQILASCVIDEASEFAKSSYKEVFDLLTQNKDTLERLANALIDKETLCEEEIDAIIAA